MTTLTITLIILLSTFFGILNGYLDAYIIMYRQAVSDARTLAHNTRATLRGVFYFFLSMLAYIGFYNADVGLMALLFTIGCSAFFTPFSYVLNTNRGLKWNYLSQEDDAATTDKILRTFGKHGMGIGMVLSYIILAGCAYLVITNY